MEFMRSRDEGKSKKQQEPEQYQESTKKPSLKDTACHWTGYIS